MRFWAGALLLLVGGCNDTERVVRLPPASPSPSPTSTTITLPGPPTPGPSPTPKVPWVTGPTSCGNGGSNADYQWFEPLDIDDPPGEADAYWCEWLCANDPTDPNPPHELLELWDFDDPAPPSLYGWSVQRSPCYSAVP